MTKEQLNEAVMNDALVIETYLKRKPADEPVYQFLDKKRSEGKFYKVYMIAAANKFLRIYYAKVN